MYNHTYKYCTYAHNDDKTVEQHKQEEEIGKDLSSS